MVAQIAFSSQILRGPGIIAIILLIYLYTYSNYQTSRRYGSAWDDEILYW